MDKSMGASLLFSDHHKSNKIGILKPIEKLMGAIGPFSKSRGAIAPL